ncbi:MAG: hypothetical protein ACRC0G_07115 [Fusobacteriaceae bacterium]
MEFDDFDEIRAAVDVLDSQETQYNGFVEIEQGVEDDVPTLETLHSNLLLADNTDIIHTQIGDLDLNEYSFGDNTPKKPLYDAFAEEINAEKKHEVIPTYDNFTNKKLAMLSNIANSRLEYAEVVSERNPSKKRRTTSKDSNAYEEFFGESEKGTSKKNKKDVDPEEKYNSKFKDRIADLDVLEGEVGEFTDMLVNNVKELYNAKAKGSFKLISESATTVSSLFSTKLSIIDKKIGITKSIADFVLKDQKANGGGSTDNNFIIDQLMNKLIHNPNTGMDLTSAVNLLDSQDYTGNVNAAMDRIDQLELNGDIQFSDSENALKYESLNPTVYVIADPSTKTWDFVALSYLEEEIPDYPLPSKSLSKMDIDWEYGQYAKDKNMGVTYPLMLRGY